ncbi:MAG: hypothetical protein JXB49_18660 [Bacteroidales bacterium]|nr:hypothetical protein [Bacteroidales bacterium]
MEYLKYIIPGLVAVIGNIIFYWIVKGRIDKSIETYKISFSGVFKEKMQIYKDILKFIFDLKLKIQRYQYTGDQTIVKEVFVGFESFINYYMVNQPYLSQSIFSNLRKMTNELQSCFEDFYKHNSLQDKRGISPEIQTELLNKFFESGNKFKKNHPFKELEDLIIEEMRTDLNTK